MRSKIHQRNNEPQMDSCVRCGEPALQEGFPTARRLVNPEGGSPRCSRSVSEGDSNCRTDGHR